MVIQENEHPRRQMRARRRSSPGSFARTVSTCAMRWTAWVFVEVGTSLDSAELHSLYVRTHLGESRTLAQTWVLVLSQLFHINGKRKKMFSKRLERLGPLGLDLVM